MAQAYVQLVCPNCDKDWEKAPTDLPKPDATFSCPDCAESYTLVEFARTKRDVETMRQLE